jgi:hypothetical protein
VDRTVGTALEPVPELMLGPGPGTKPETGLGPGPATEPETVLETVLELETVGKVLEPLPELVQGQGTPPETIPGLEMEAETEQDNKHSVLHPYHESVVRRKIGLVGIRILLLYTQYRHQLTGVPVGACAACRFISPINQT